MPVFIGAALILWRGRESAQEADLADMPDMLASSPICSVEGLMDDLA